MAKFSWMSVLLSIVVNVALQSGSAGHHTKEEALGQAIVVGLIMLAGVVCGIAALCGIPKYGSKGLVWPALTGLLLWLGLSAIAVPNFLRAREMALKVRAAQAQRIDLTPAIYSPGTGRLKDTELAFSFDIPAGYQPVPAESLPKRYRYAYIHPNPGEPASVIIVTIMAGTHLTSQHLGAADIPPGKGATLTNFSWRGLVVDGFRVLEKSPQGEFITFNIQIPLKKRTIQVGFGGPIAQEAETRALATQTLASLEGEPNWP